MTYASNYTNKATIFDNGDVIQGDHVKSIYDQLGPDGGWQEKAPTVIGRFYDGDWFGSTIISSYQHASNVLMAFWYCLPRTGTLDELGTNVTTAAASGTLRIGLYEADDTASKLPGTLIVAHSGTLSTTSTGYKSAAISQAVERRGVWAVVQTGVAAAVTWSVAANFSSLGRVYGSSPTLAARTLLATRTDAALGSLAGTSWTVSERCAHGVLVKYST